MPAVRIRPLNTRPVRNEGDYVLYWMTASRRLSHNFALQRAAEHARALHKPLVILEALRSDHPWACRRFHAFVLQGMAEHREALAGGGVGYHPYVELERGSGKGLLETLASEAAVVVTDDFPAFFLPRMTQTAADRIPISMEAVDSNGLLPMAVPERTFTTAYSFRRYLQKTLPDHLGDVPAADPLGGLDWPVAPPLPSSITERWPAATDDLLSVRPEALKALPVDVDVGVVPTQGGARAARRTLDAFLETRIQRYGEDRNSPDRDASSRLSPFLHWGMISAHEVFQRVADMEGWSPARLTTKPEGKRHGWWSMSHPAEAFLDELITWREIGFNMCFREPASYDRYGSLPEWARVTLAEHSEDPRPHLYSLEQFQASETHDPLWNAAQRELVREGRIHNYLRMLWGKKILEWSPSAEDALGIMLELNNRYALDGRDPNSYSGVFWVLGRYDRGWPERPIYGKVRSMSSDSTRRKVDLDAYLDTYGA